MTVFLECFVFEIPEETMYDGLTPFGSARVGLTEVLLVIQNRIRYNLPASKTQSLLAVVCREFNESLNEHKSLSFTSGDILLFIFRWLSYVIERNK
jgi:hypothetical protein